MSTTGASIFVATVIMTSLPKTKKISYKKSPPNKAAPTPNDRSGTVRGASNASDHPKKLAMPVFASRLNCNASAPRYRATRMNAMTPPIIGASSEDTASAAS